MDPAGTLVVLALGDGREIIRARTAAMKSLESVVVRRSADRYVLIASSPTAEENVFGDPVSPGNVSVGGWVYAFDARSGKRLWVTRIPNQTFSVQQASGLPVLTFLRNHMKQLNRAQCRFHAGVADALPRHAQRPHPTPEFGARPGPPI